MNDPKKTAKGRRLLRPSLASQIEEDAQALYSKIMGKLTGKPVPDGGLKTAEAVALEEDLGLLQEVAESASEADLKKLDEVGVQSRPGESREEYAGRLIAECDGRIAVHGRLQLICELQEVFADFFRDGPFTAPKSQPRDSEPELREWKESDPNHKSVRKVANALIAEWNTEFLSICGGPERAVPYYKHGEVFFTEYRRARMDLVRTVFANALGDATVLQKVGSVAVREMLAKAKKMDLLG